MKLHIGSGPVAERRPILLEAHGDARIDDWYWLRNIDDPQTLIHLKRENQYFASWLEEDPIRTAVYEEFAKNVGHSDINVPVRRGDWLYGKRMVEGQEYCVHYRRPVGDKTCYSEQILLDENELAAGFSYFSCGTLELSPDQFMLAYLVDRVGDELYTLHVRDLRTGKDFEESISRLANGGLAWAQDSKTIFYIRADENMRPSELWRHVVGTPTEDDVCLYTESDEHFFVSVSKTKDGSLILMDISSHVSSEVRFVHAAAPLDHFQTIEPRCENILYSVDHHQGWLLILTNENAENLKLYETPLNSTLRANWREVLPHRPNIRIDQLEVFENYLVLQERKDGQTDLRVIPLPVRDTLTGKVAPREPFPSLLTLDSHIVQRDEQLSELQLEVNPDFYSSVLRYELNSMVIPRSIYEYDMHTRQYRLLERAMQLTDEQLQQFESERIFAHAEDGTQIPITLVYRKGLQKDGSNPCVLYGYGAYGESVPLFCNPFRFTLLDRGFVFAVAHVRGGGELGEHWHQAGALLQKRNSITDFVTCAHHLIDKGYTSSERLVARGGSAGGLLVAGAVNLEPTLFAGVVAEVPFVDCLTSLMDPELPLTVLEWDEWGNPIEVKEVYWSIKSYSPYDNIQETAYPPILATAALHDYRVGYWESAKWILRLREKSTNGNPVFLKMNLETGHLGHAGRFEDWKHESYLTTFILKVTGTAHHLP